MADAPPPTPMGHLYHETHNGDPVAPPTPYFSAEQMAQQFNAGREFEAERQAARAPSPSVAAPADQRINTIADGIFDYQRISEKMPPLDREGFRELIGSAIAQWDAPQPPRPGTALLSDEQAHALLERMAAEADDWGERQPFEPTKEQVSGWCVAFLQRELAGSTTPTKDPQ